MKLTIVIASLLGVFLAPALATGNGKNNVNEYYGKNSHHSFTDTEVSSNSKEDSGAWKSVWDGKTGYVATKVFSKNTCIISKLEKNLLLDKRFLALPEGYEGPSSDELPRTNNRFTISRNRLQSLRPYGKRIQALCRGIPSYFAYPAAGSNFLRPDDSYLKVKINELPVYYYN